MLTCLITKTDCISLEVAKSALKAASKKYNDTDVTNRSIIESAVEKTLQESLNSKYAAGIVLVNKISLDNIDFDDQYNKAIADKQNAQLENEKQQIINKNNIEKTQAEAQAKEIQADGQCDVTAVAYRRYPATVLDQ